MADICELDYGDYVIVNGQIYFVYGVSFEDRTAELVSINIVENYHNDEKILRQNVEKYHVRQITKLPPVRVEEDILRNLFRLETTSWKLVTEGKYPFGAVTGKFSVTEEDMMVLLENLREIDSELVLDFWNANFSGDGTYLHASYPKIKEPGFSFAYFCDHIVNIISWFDPKDKYEKRLLYELLECYRRSKEKPLKDIVLPDDYKGDMLSIIEDYSKNNPITEEMREYYIATLDELCEKSNTFEIKRKAYAYYGGNGIVECDWKKAEESLLQLYEIDGDEYAANSLGYIYYSNRLGSPDYEKAFYYFSYAAGNGLVEATYKLSDMYRKGHGTKQNFEKAWQLLTNLYEGCNKKNKAKGKYPDIMLRRGYCYRDGVGAEKNAQKALECFMEAKVGIELRIKKHKGYGDEVVLKNVLEAIESVTK